MSHTIIYNPETHSVNIKVQGNVTFDYIKEMLEQTTLVVKENNARCLLHDYRKAQWKLSTSEIYELPRIAFDAYASIGINALSLERVAVVAKNFKDARFLETVFVNTGQHVKVTYDIDEARKWVC
jgi:hypothetical protein